jgi:hypothetical protein
VSNNFRLLVLYNYNRAPTSLSFVFKLSHPVSFSLCVWTVTSHLVGDTTTETAIRVSALIVSGNL